MAVRLRSAWVLMYCIAFITHPPLIFFVYTKLGCNCWLISLNCGTREINEMKLELQKPKQVLMQRPLLRLHPDGFHFYESAITQMSVSISFDGQLPGNSLSCESAKIISQASSKNLTRFVSRFRSKVHTELNIPLEVGLGV